MMHDLAAKIAKKVPTQLWSREFDTLIRSIGECKSKVLRNSDARPVFVPLPQSLTVLAHKAPPRVASGAAVILLCSMQRVMYV